MSSAITQQQGEETRPRPDLDILNEYMRRESATTASQAAAALAQSIDAPDELFFWDFWNDVFQTAEKMAHDDPAQDRLVAFLRELKLVPDTGRTVWEARVWTDLPILGAAIREHIDEIDANDSSIALHAFIARLLQAGISPGSQVIAIWMLRDALEEDGKNPAQDLDCVLMRAAVYIEYAGATLVHELALRPEPELDATQKRMTKGGRLWKGPAGLNVERWKFWGSRFRKLGEGASSPDAKHLALHAARLMEMWTSTQLSA